MRLCSRQFVLFYFCLLGFGVLSAENPMMLAMERAADASKKTDDTTSEKKQTSDESSKKASDTQDKKDSADDKEKSADKVASKKPEEDKSASDAKPTEDKQKEDPTAKKDPEPSESNQKPQASEATTSPPAAAVTDGKATLAVVDVQTSGLDTTAVESGGNWLEKRIWYKKAEQLFDEIRSELKKIADTRMEFVKEVHAVGQKIDEFYEKVSFEKGQVDALLKNVLDDIAEASSKRGGDLSSKERNLKLSIQTEQKQLEQLGKDIKKIGDFDSQIDKTMMQAFKIVDNCRELETKAWEAFKSIGVELDDKKARGSYYEIENFYKNIGQNYNYLKTVLLPYLKTKLVAPVEKAMDQIQSAVKSLDEKGINVEKLIKQQEKKDLGLIEEREKETEEDVEHQKEQEWKKQAAEEEKKKKEAEKHAKELAEEQEHEEEEKIWYYRLFFKVKDFSRCVFCWTVEKVRCVVCSIFHYTKDVSSKTIAEASDDISPSILDMFKAIWCKIIEIVCLIGCYIKHVLCTGYSWLTAFFVGQ